jgi:hypothetical protein
MFLRPTSSCRDSLDVVAVAVDVKSEARVEGCLSTSLAVQCRLQARSVGPQSASACWQVNLCEVWKVHLRLLPLILLQRRPYSSSRSVVNPRALCTATPYSEGSPAMPFRSRFWRHSSMALGKHCGNRSDLVPHATNGGLGLRCSVPIIHVSDHSRLPQSTPNPPGPRNRSRWSKSDSIRRKSSAWTTPAPFADSCWPEMCGVCYHAQW